MRVRAPRGRGRGRRGCASVARKRRTSKAVARCHCTASMAAASPSCKPRDVGGTATWVGDADWGMAGRGTGGQAAPCVRGDSVREGGEGDGSDVATAAHVGSKGQTGGKHEGQGGTRRPKSVGLLWSTPAVLAPDCRDGREREQRRAAPGVPSCRGAVERREAVLPHPERARTHVVPTRRPGRGSPRARRQRHTTAGRGDPRRRPGRGQTAADPAGARAVGNEGGRREGLVCGGVWRVVCGVWCVVCGGGVCVCACSGSHVVLRAEPGPRARLRRGREPGRGIWKCTATWTAVHCSKVPSQGGASAGPGPRARPRRGREPGRGIWKCTATWTAVHCSKVPSQGGASAGRATRTARVVCGEKV